LSVDVGVHEVRVQDQRPRAREVRSHSSEGKRVDVGAQADHVYRHAAAAQCVREIVRSGLVLVQLEQAHVPAALPQARQQREQVRLRAGDAGDLRQVQDGAARHRASSSSFCAHGSTA
jgi:hypothetical protein